MITNSSFPLKLPTKEKALLMKLMGHSDFNTTQKYYISISNKRKKLAMEKAYESILEKENKILKFQN